MTFPLRESPPIDLVTAPRPWERFGEVLCDLPGERFADIFKRLRRSSQTVCRYRWLSTHDEEVGRVLLHIVEPPRLFIERLATDLQLTLFQQQAPGLWTPLGFRSLQ